MARGIHVTSDRVRERSRELRFSVWLDQSTAPKPTLGFVSAFEPLDEKERGDIDEGRVLELALSASWTPDSIADEKVIARMREAKSEQQAILLKNIDADRQGSLAGYEE